MYRADGSFTGSGNDGIVPSNFNNSLSFFNQPPTYKKVTSNEDWIAYSTGKIYVNSSSAPLGTGSGFHIGNGYFLTAGHCVPKDFSINNSYIAFELENKIYEIENVIANGIKDGLDFSLIKLREVPPYKVDLNFEKPENHIGKDIVITHHPHGKNLTLSTGIISNMDNDENRLAMDEKPGVFRYDPSTMKGSSGSPVGLVNEKEVLGVHVQGDEDTQAFHAATSINAIEAYLTHYGFSLLTAIAKKTTTPNYSN